MILKLSISLYFTILFFCGIINLGDDNMRVRVEKDLIGEKELPIDAYYGIHTLRGKENFEITKKGLNRQMIKGLTVVKKAAAKANADSGILTDKQAKAILLTCDEILNGRLHGQLSLT